MKSLVQHITEGLKDNAPLLEGQDETTIVETEAKPEPPQSVLDLANVAPENEDVD